MTPSNKQWAQAHYGHDIHARNETARRAGDPLVTAAYRPSRNYRAIYGYDHGASDIMINPDLRCAHPKIIRNGRELASCYGPDGELNAALFMQASAMRNLLINVLEGNINLASIHDVLQRATLKR